MNLKKKFFCLLTVLVIISGVLFAMLINSIPKPAEIEGKYIKSEKMKLEDIILRCTLIILDKIQ